MFNSIYVNWLFSYIKKGMLVEVGNSEISPDFGSILKLLVAQNEYLAFAPDTEETHFMVDALALKFPLVKVTRGQNRIPNITHFFSVLVSCDCLIDQYHSLTFSFILLDGRKNL